MKRIITIVVVAAVAAGIAIFAALGGFSSGSANASTNKTVTTMNVSGVGSVLTTSSGMPLYTNNQDVNGVIHCNGSCTVVWKPLTVAKGVSPTGTTAAGTLGVVARAGADQVTLNGAPLYTFYLDSSGKVTGNNVTDSFGGLSFTWHVVTINASGGSSGGTSGGSSNGASGGGSGGYGY